MRICRIGSLILSAWIAGAFAQPSSPGRLKVPAPTNVPASSVAAASPSPGRMKVAPPPPESSYRPSSDAFTTAAGESDFLSGEQMDPMDEFLDMSREATAFQSKDGQVNLDFDFYFSMDNWGMSQPPPPIIQNSNNYLASPRLSVLAQNDFYDIGKIVVLGRLDRGFDPTDGPAQVRPDEFYFVGDPLDGVFRVTVGKMGTGMGQWSRRYVEWENPMVNAPLAYEWLTTATSDGASSYSSSTTTTAIPIRNPFGVIIGYKYLYNYSQQGGAGAFLNRRNVVSNRSTWIPIIWGPAYTTGARVDGTVEQFDYVFEIKNNAPSSSPADWNPWNHFYATGLNYGGRLGWRPTMDWNLGVSASTGPYLNPDAQGMTGGNSWYDYNQNVIGMDASWARGPLQIWGEGWWSSFDIPGGVGTVSLWSYFLESKWKFAPNWWLSTRWNQQIYGEIANPNGGYTPWGNDVWRVDACLGYSINRMVTLKMQYSYTGESGSLQQGQHLGDVQVVFAF